MTTTAPPTMAPTISPDVSLDMTTSATTFARIGLAATCDGLSLIQAHELVKILTVLRARGATELHHGMCEGGDDQANTIAHEAGYRTVGHPLVDGRYCDHTDCDEYRRPLHRDSFDDVIVRETDLLLAFPRTDAEQYVNSNVWLTIRRAGKRGMPRLVILPGGVVYMNEGLDAVLPPHGSRIGSSS